jgi:hypothetical protein
MDLAFAYPQLALPAQRHKPWDILYVPAVAAAYETASVIVPNWDGLDVAELRRQLPTHLISFAPIDDRDQTLYGSLKAGEIAVPKVGRSPIVRNSTGYAALIRAGFGPHYAIIHADNYHRVVKDLDEARRCWARYQRFEDCTPEHRLQIAQVCGVDINLLKEANFQKEVVTAADVDPYSVGGERLVPKPITAKMTNQPTNAKITWATGYTRSVIKSGGVRSNIINADLAQSRMIGGLLTVLLNRDADIMGVVGPCSSAITGWCLLLGVTGAGKTPILKAIQPVKRAIETYTNASRIHRKYLAAVAGANKAKKAPRITLDEEYGLRAPCRFVNDMSMAAHDQNVAAQTYWRKPSEPGLEAIVNSIGMMPNYGFCLFAAEASGLFGSLSQFNQSATYSTAKLLALWTNCEGGVSLRARNKTTIAEENSSMSILGGIQDTAYANYALRDHQTNGGLGLTARFTLIPVYNVGAKRDGDYRTPEKIIVPQEYIAAIGQQGQQITRWVCECAAGLEHTIADWIDGLLAAGEVRDKVLKYHENLLRSALAFECNEMLNRAAVGQNPIVTNHEGDGVISEICIERAYHLMKLNHETHVRMVSVGKEQALNNELAKADRGHLVRERMASGQAVERFLADIETDVFSKIALGIHSAEDFISSEIPGSIVQAAKCVVRYDEMIDRIHQEYQKNQRGNAILD